MVDGPQKSKAVPRTQRHLIRWLLVGFGCNSFPLIYLTVYLVRDGCLGRFGRTVCGDVACYTIWSWFIGGNLCFLAIVIAHIRNRQKKGTSWIKKKFD